MAILFGADASGNGNNWTSNNFVNSGGSTSQTVTFRSSTTWIAPANVTSVNYLVVAGGGGGGGNIGGGGGAGGMVTGTLTITPGESYTVTVGAGGAGGAGATSSCGVAGSNSVFGSITALGGGYGGSGTSSYIGGNGGSGGGGARAQAGSATHAGGTGTSGQGNNGGSAVYAGGSNNNTSGGGGGAGIIGGNGGAGVNGAGGSGLSSSVSGSSVTYAGGGGGGSFQNDAGTGGSGGSGGGGAGSPSGNGTAGTANLGGGGGGGGQATAGTQGAGGEGGSGIVILSYTTDNNSSTYDSMTDVPAIASTSLQADVGGVQRGNYPTMNPLYKGYGSYTAAPPTLSNGNLTITGNSSANNVAATMEVQGKCYFETTWATQGNNNGAVGIINTSGQTVYLDGYYDAVYSLGSSVASLTFAVGDTIGVAVDKDAGTVSFYRNGVFGYTAVTQLNNTEWFPWIYVANNDVLHVNFGQRPFVYTPPTGFKTLNSTNLQNPVIKRPSDHFDIKTYAGNGTSLTVGNTQKQSSGYTINKSVRLRSTNGAYLTRTPGTASNRKTFTWSGWIKRANTGSGTQELFVGSASTGGTLIFTGIRFIDDVLYIQDVSVGTYNIWWSTSLPYQNASAWYNIVVKYDTTQASSGNAVALWVNGVQQPLSFTANTGAYVQNRDSYINAANSHHIGATLTSSGSDVQNYFNGYIAESHFIDGQTLTASSFGAFDANNNWVPQRYTGTYGTNGFYLKFSDNSDNTAATLGADSSGNGNNWTPNNIQLGATPPATFTSNTTWTVPAGVTSITASVWGAGGNSGGAGAFAKATIPVTAAETLYIQVGTVDNNGAGGYGYAGGGYSGIFRTSVSQANALLIAGGGGGGGRGSQAGTLGGWGGDPNGGPGQSGSPGQGATTSAGGSGGGSPAGATGSALTGGNGGTGNTYTGSGGGSGYYGGGGGGSGTGGGGAGGGGSSFSAAPNTNVSYAKSQTALGAGRGDRFYNSSTTNYSASSTQGYVAITYASASTPTNQFYDSMLDSPTDTVDSSGNVIGNYAVLGGRPAGNATYPWTLYDGNLRFTGSYAGPQSTLSMKTGKWYWETTGIANTSYNPRIGIINKEWASTNGTLIGDTATSYGYTADGSLGINGSYTSSWGATYTDGNVIGVAFDADSGKLWFSKDGTWQASGDPAAGTNPATIVPNIYEYVAATGTGSSGGGYNAVYNFGQRPFANTPPTGFKSLNTKNLKDVGGYNLPDSFGNFVNTPDLVWIKNRTESYNHILQDTVRGPSKYSDLTQGVENTGVTTAVQAFLPNGFQIGSISGGNKSTNNHIAWAWNRGRTPGFDIVTYNGNATNYVAQTIAHNLGTPPAFMMVKALTDSTAGNRNWNIYHKGLGPGYTTYMSTVAPASNTDIWQNKAPDSNNFYVGGAANAQEINYTGGSYVAYLWAEVPGFSKFGTYTGNATTNNVFLYTGFTPAFFMVKRTDSTGNWLMYDNKRPGFNGGAATSQSNYYAFANTSYGGDGTDNPIDFLSNGIKIRADGGIGTGSYIYIAFAEVPFKYANAR